MPGMGAPDMDYGLTLPSIEPNAEEAEASLNQPFMEDIQHNDTKEEVLEHQADSAIQQPSDTTDTVKEESTESPVKAESPPVSEYDSLQARLAENRYDPSTWNKLIDLAEQSGDLAKIKEAYESLLQAYPNIVRLFFLYIVCMIILSDLCVVVKFGILSFLYLKAEAQIAYLEHYLHPGLFPNAEALFNRFLRPSPSVQLWKFYLTYVRRMNADPSTRDTINKAYDFALLYIGQDKDSGEIWREYIDFIKAGETHTTWEEQQKMDALRRIYQRVVQIPLEIVEQLWSEYNAFEIGLNKITARKFIQDQSKAYMTAKEILKQLRLHLGILFPPPAIIPSSGRKPFNLPEPTSPYSEGHRMLAKSWRSYLQWEEKNPLDIEDKSVFNARMMSIYKKAVIRMRFNPETWYMAYSWTEKHMKPDEAISFLKAGLEANPASFVLNFANAEALENTKSYAEVHTMFTKFIEILHVELEKQVKAAPFDNPLILNGSAITQPSSSSGSGSSGSVMTPQKEFAKRRTELCIAWITYMRFARRAEGLKPARAVFGKARKDKWIGWEVYEAAATLEYHFTKATDVATRIYETGLKQFGEEAEYVMRYLKFLIQINDENNARALFERVIGTFTPEKARPLWETWVGYEYNYGDLSAAVKLEKRMSEVYPDDNSMRRFAQRHMYANHDPIAERDLGWIRQSAGISGSSNGSIKADNSFSTPSFTILQTGSPQKRNAPSPERGRPPGRSDSQDRGPPPSKRPRELSPIPPPRDRERRERERREVPPPRRRSPDWNRNSPPRRANDRGDWERDADDKPGVAPSMATYFLSQLPTAASFDGPVFRVDDLMQVFRNANIPVHSGPARPHSPPRGRPPPDYSPYQGPPGGARGGRRY
ncbi:hypothetical protein BU17DRAFT_89425 [Hysterangium stoloniferum]|nr:hypothetical protein BU17DRAFT_89425 [Hysterangium stoloniferum]